MRHRDFLIRSAIEYAFRRRPPGFWLISVGAAMLIALLGGLAFRVEATFQDRPLHLSFSTESVGGLATYAAVLVALTLIGLGVQAVRRDWAIFDRRSVVVIELRGLRDWKGEPLTEALPAGLPGRREEVAIDLRQGLVDGVISDAQVALGKLMNLKPRLEQIETWKDRTDVSFVVGGLAPTPYSFLTGVILDDEAALTFWDWDRDARAWREPDEEDDGERFVVNGLLGVSDDVSDVLVLVSVSYLADRPAAEARVGDIPIVSLTLPNPNTANHWSADKQIALGRQFLNVMSALKGKRIGRAHLVLAAQNSVALRFGALYDKRLLPPVTVYQYEGGAFTWGVDMPVAGASVPTLTTTSPSDPAPRPGRRSAGR
jgi:hypothetical protein